jgi:NADPH:quinone reductase-like Zn-dependent oxidoreductase
MNPAPPVKPDPPPANDETKNPSASHRLTEGKHWLDATPSAQIAESYRRPATLVSEGVLAAPVEATYPLEECRDALAHAARPGRTGKVLFTW